MTSHPGRLYALALALVVFFLAWAIVAAHPWATTASDPRLRALAAPRSPVAPRGEARQQVVAARWAAYRAQPEAKAGRDRDREARATSAAHAASVASAPAVHIMTLPPHVITRTS